MTSILKVDQIQTTAGASHSLSGLGITERAGGVVQTVTASTGFANQTINSASKVAVTGMSVTITPIYSNSKMLIMGYLHGSFTYVAGLAIYKDGTTLISGNTGTNQSSGSVNLWTHYTGAYGSSTDKALAYPFMYVDTVSSTSATTYQLYLNSGWSGGTNATYVNNRASNDMLSQSWICVQEIKA